MANQAREKRGEDNEFEFDFDFELFGSESGR